MSQRSIFRTTIFDYDGPLLQARVRVTVTCDSHGHETRSEPTELRPLELWEVELAEQSVLFFGEILALPMAETATLGVDGNNQH
jgi:hypothetical protein